ncbi:MAG: WXG100 family type VII secretion target [Clostridia bacterium]|nr:WXG100 family type VII secretion target [Clostridia bacterium]
MDIAIQTNPLRRDAESMAEEVARLRKNMSSMNDAITSMNSMWQGAAHNAFVTQYASDYQKMTEVCQALDNIIECLNYAAAKYDECDNNVKNIVNSIKI